MSDDQVEEVKNKTDIVSIIGERIELKKAGRNYKANCPFHGEKTPSFMVSPDLQIFKCFGCGEGGDAFTFLEKFEGMEFPEALKYLAERAGIKLKRTNFGESSEKEKIIEINTQALRFYNYLLLNHPVGKTALEYLMKDRGLKKETIEAFKLGFSPYDSRMFKKFLVDKKKFTPSEVERAGLGIVRGVNVYDRFGGRVIFPLFDHRGNPVGFAGRIMPGGRTDTAKYVNSPETPAYHKSKILFGLNETRGNIKKKGVAIITEGELDAISSWQAGIKNVVAIKGSALTDEQVTLLSRFAGKFILALDADMAGDAASRRGLAVASNMGVEVKVARLSGGYKDPDDAARGNPDGYKKDLINAQGVWDFLIDSVMSRFDAGTGAGKAKISKELIPIISQIQDKIVQAHYINVVAKKLGVPLEAVAEQISKAGTSAPQKEDQMAVSAKLVKDRRNVLEDRLLTMAFQSEPSILLKAEIKEMIREPVNTRLLTEYENSKNTLKPFEISKFGSILPAELFEAFSKLVLEEDQSLQGRPEEIQKELDLVQKELKIHDVKEKLKKLADLMRTLEETGEVSKLLKAQNEFNNLAKKLSGYEEGDGGGIIFREKTQ